MDEKTRRVSGEELSGRADEYIGGGEPDTRDPDTRDATRGAYRTGRTAPESMRNYAAPAPIDASAADRTTTLRREIEQTREDMSDTVDEIQERLRPGAIASNAKETVKAKARDAIQDAAETVKTKTRDAVQDAANSDSVQYVRANPIPAAMIGVGVAGLVWLAVGGRKAPDRMDGRSGRRWTGYETDDALYESSIAERHAGGESAGAYSPGMSFDTPADRLTSRASETADDVLRRAERTTRRARLQVNRTWQESPLLVGAAAAVAGVLVGLAIPETERENQLMGETRDEVVEGVQQSVRNTVGRVQEAAKGAAGLIGNEDKQQ